jgi:hypothetical protein
MPDIHEVFGTEKDIGAVMKDFEREVVIAPVHFG